MGRVMLALGALGLGLGLYAAFSGRRLTEDPTMLKEHVMWSLAATLILIWVNSWVALFTLGSYRSLRRQSLQRRSGRPPKPLRRWSCGISAMAAIAAVTSGANFVVGFGALSADLSTSLHVALAFAWLSITIVALVVALRGLGLLEDFGDQIERQTAGSIG